MRVLQSIDDPHAREAIELFVYRAVLDLGALAAVLGGLDALVKSGPGRTLISAPGSAVAVCVIPADEEIVIARHTRTVLLLKGQFKKTKGAGKTAGC